MPLCLKAILKFVSANTITIITKVAITKLNASSQRKDFAALF